MESKINKYKVGDIIKKDLSSRQSWTVVPDMYGNLVARPNTNKFFKETEPIEIEEDYIVIDSINIKD